MSERRCLAHVFVNFHVYIRSFNVTFPRTSCHLFLIVAIDDDDDDDGDDVSPCLSDQ
jgi:hypothetical protein